MGGLLGQQLIRQGLLAHDVIGPGPGTVFYSHTDGFGSAVSCFPDGSDQKLEVGSGAVQDYRVDIRTVVEIDSDAGVGTTVTVYFPAERTGPVPTDESQPSAKRRAA